MKKRFFAAIAVIILILMLCIASFTAAELTAAPLSGEGDPAPVIGEIELFIMHPFTDAAHSYNIGKWDEAYGIREDYTGSDGWEKGVRWRKKGEEILGPEDTFEKGTDYVAEHMGELRGFLEG